MDFKKWFEMLSPVPFPTRSKEQDPYINGKWATSAFQTGRYKKRKIDRVNSDYEDKRKKDDDATGYHL